MTGTARRAFLALDLDEQARQRLRELMDALRGRFQGIRWARPEGLHLTLRFLGWAEDQRLEGVAGRVEPAAAAAPPATVPMGGLGLFPERGQPSVLWVGLSLPPPLQSLQQACEQAARDEGFAPEERSFTPHLTLGRWSGRTRRPTLPAIDVGPARLDRLVLYQSETKQGGAVYTPLRTFALGGSGR